MKALVFWIALLASSSWNMQIYGYVQVEEGSQSATKLYVKQQRGPGRKLQLLIEKGKLMT